MKAIRGNVLQHVLKPLPEWMLRSWADKYGVDKYSKIHSTISDLYANVYLNVAELDSLTHLCTCLDRNPFLRKTCKYEAPISISQNRQGDGMTIGSGSLRRPALERLKSMEVKIYATGELNEN